MKLTDVAGNENTLRLELRIQAESTQEFAALLSTFVRMSQEESQREPDYSEWIGRRVICRRYGIDEQGVVVDARFRDPPAEQELRIEIPAGRYWVLASDTVLVEEEPERRQQYNVGEMVIVKHRCEQRFRETGLVVAIDAKGPPRARYFIYTVSFGFENTETEFPEAHLGHIDEVPQAWMRYRLGQRVRCAKKNSASAYAGDFGHIRGWYQKQYLVEFKRSDVLVPMNEDSLESPVDAVYMADELNFEAKKKTKAAKGRRK